ncbi:MAG: pyridoxal phosphate-dependent aminotransferase [Burkholderiales bacterium]|nr:pyridoxal phosphate-dependent aminotransferase [Burkholderiales bacterium]
MNAPARPGPPYPTAARLGVIEPFHAMALFRRAVAREAAGRSVIHMSLGEPDFGAPPAVVAALDAAIRAGQAGYTPACGITPLREAIAAHYARVHGVDVAPQRIVVTAGATGALQLACALLLDPGSEVLMPDPTYPCNRHIVSAFNATTTLIPAGPEKRFQLDAADIAAHWGPRTRGAMLASPSNPTGTTIAPAQLQAVLDALRARSGFLVFDEIYNELTYGAEKPRTALALGDDVIVLNSFSKYFCMTGWRLGWMVVPEALAADVEKLAMNLFICPPATAQHAALACFAPESIGIYEQRRAEFARRRDFIVPALRELGFGVPTEPDGAFYVYADCARFGVPSEQLADRLLDEAGVCLVPGIDFGVQDAQRWMRVTYSTSLERLHEAVERMRRYLATP